MSVVNDAGCEAAVVLESVCAANPKADSSASAHVSIFMADLLSFLWVTLGEHRAPNLHSPATILYDVADEDRNPGRRRHRARDRARGGGSGARGREEARGCDRLAGVADPPARRGYPPIDASPGKPPFAAPAPPPGPPSPPAPPPSPGPP